MSYSCTDFADSILDALHIRLDEEDYDNPAAQADLALAEITRLQRAAKSTVRVELIADIIYQLDLTGYDVNPEILRADLARQFAQVLKGTNPRFACEKFLIRCNRGLDS